MKGEKLGWFELASHLSMSLQRCQQETTSTEFLEWMVFLEMKDSFKPEYYYWAQIAYEIRRCFSKSSNKLGIENFILKFKNKKKKVKKLTKEEYTKLIKAKMFAMVGYKPKE